MKKWYGAAVCVAMGICLTGCQKKAAEPIPNPIEPERVAADMTEETDDAFALSILPWDMTKESAMAQLKEYTLVSDDGDFCVYQTDGTLEDGTPVREQIQVGFTSEDGTVAGVKLVFYLEESEENKREQITEQISEDLKKFENNATVTPISPGRDEETAVAYEKDSGSYIRLNSGEISADMISELGLEWEKAGVVGISYWLPEKKGDLAK